MFKMKTETGPAAFHKAFQMLPYSYPTRLSSANYSKPKTRLSTQK